MKSAFPFILVLAASSLAPAGAGADDPWDAPTWNDDSSDTVNALLPGDRQTHDLEAPGAGLRDEDWYLAYGYAGHSYEARITGFSTDVSTLDDDANRTIYHRVDSVGNVVQNSVCSQHPTLGVCLERTLRFTAPTDGYSYLRVTGTPNAPSSAQYTMEFFDTSYAIPRFNNSATQTTILLIQNATRVAVAGSVVFYNPTGVQLGTAPLSLAPAGVQVLNTAAVSGVGGQAGSVLVSHDGAFGALSGKAVALEPATGFTFDTAMSPIAQ